ncbi:MAG: VOC family protein [Gammaproteobacteria bacterium]
MATLTTPQPSRHPHPTVRASALAYLIFERPDLGLAARYLDDFGLVEVARDDACLVLRGTGSAPLCYVVRHGPRARFVGFALNVAEPADLERLAALSCATAIAPTSLPGGGELVALKDPSGFVVHAVHGQTASAALPRRAALALNDPDHPARVDATQRPPRRPPEVLKLGHVALEVADYQATCAWYTAHFGFIPSDLQVLPDGSPAVAFMRLDLGDEPADHHTLALVQGFAPRFNHAAFEVVDADAVGMGQRVLRDAGWRHAWGMGRHVLGSQIFDYWEDPWGDKHEHYCDGDRFTTAVPTGVHPAAREDMAQWGQPMPASFTRPKLTLANLAALWRGLRRSPDVTPGKLFTLMKTFG